MHELILQVGYENILHNESLAYILEIFLMIIYMYLFLEIIDLEKYKTIQLLAYLYQYLSPFKSTEVSTYVSKKTAFNWYTGISHQNAIFSNPQNSFVF